MSLNLNHPLRKQTMYGGITELAAVLMTASLIKVEAEPEKLTPLRVLIVHSRFF